jgi:hypothetical protein
MPFHENNQIRHWGTLEGRQEIPSSKVLVPELRAPGRDDLSYSDGFYDREVASHQGESEKVKQGQHFWVFVQKIKDGKIKWVNIGFQNSYDEAQSMGMEQSGAYSFEVIPFATRDSGKANGCFKKWQLDHLSGIDEATNTMLRKPADERIKRQKLAGNPQSDNSFFSDFR